MPSFPARYSQPHFLGEGGMGQVYRVFDQDRQAEVALKLHAPPAGTDAEDSRFLFRQEFWAMASLRHPQLVAAYDYGELTDGHPYFTMAIVQGQDLAEAGLPQAESAVRGWLPGVAAALSALHRAGYVHGDLKPENIRVLPDGSGMLMDLGLLRRRGSVGGPIRGSLPYMAPEAVRQGAVDARTDLYGLGAVLFEALAGRPPFATTEPVALLKAHLNQAPERLEHLAPALGGPLATAVARLLAKEPGGRYASADALLAALDLGQDESAEATMLSSPLVGRAEIQRALTAQGPGTLWLTGPSGSGKTRLLAEARAEAQLAGKAVFAAAGQGEEAPPYQAALPWLRALTARPGAAREAALPVLARLLPEIAVAPLPALDGPKERLRLHTAIAALARAVAPEAVWLIDDADRLDAASTELVTYLRRQGDLASDTAWTWLLGAEQPPTDAQGLPLGPLSAEATGDLARALLGQDMLPGPIAERLDTLAGGLPGAIEALIGHWLASGMLVRTAGAWQPAPGASFDVPDGWDTPLDLPAAGGSPDALALVRAAAVLGTEGELAALAAIAPIPEGAFFAAFATLETAHVLERQESRFRFLRPALAQALEAGLDEGVRHALHDRAAAWLASRLGTDPASPSLPLGDVLAAARHLLAGSAPAQALGWVLAGADRAIAMFAIASASPLLRRALAEEALTPEARVALQARLGFTLRYNGQLDEALALYESEVVPALRRLDGATLAQELVTLGSLYQMKSRYPEARALLDEAIALADSRSDVTTSIRARIFAGRVGYFAGDAAAAKVHLAEAVTRARVADSRALLARALSVYGFVVAAEGPARRAEGLALLDEAAMVSRDLGDLLEALEAMNNQGNVLVGAGRLAEARRVYEGCVALCERVGTPNELVFAQLSLGATLLELGEYRPAATLGHQAAATSRLQSRKFPQSYGMAVEGLALVRLGDFAAAAQLADSVALAREIANKYVELHVLVLQAEALVYLGDAAGAARAIAEAEALAAASQNAEHRLKLLRLAGAVAVLEGRPGAAALLAEAADAAREAEVTPAIAQALSWQARLALAQPDGAKASAWLDTAAALAQGAGLVGLSAEIAVLRAQAAEREGDVVAAADFWADAHPRALASGDALLEVLAALGDPGRPELAGPARARLDALLAPVSPADRATLLNVPGRSALQGAPAAAGGGMDLARIRQFVDLSGALAATHDLDDLMGTSVDALLTLTGLDRGFLLLYQGFEVTRQVFRGMSEAEADAYSSSLANRVLWSGRALFIEDAQSDAELGGQQSVQALHLKTVLGLPLVDGAEVIGVMLADARRVVEGFGEADMELALALATQVGAAVAHTRRLAAERAGHDTYRELHDLALATAGADTLAAFMAPLTARALALTGAERALLLMGPALTCRAGFTAEGRLLEEAPADVSTSISRYVLEKGEPLQLEDVQNDEAFQAQRSVMALGLRTVVAVPVRVQERVIGVLYLDARRLLEPSPRAMPVLQGIADMMGAFWARRGESATSDDAT